MLTYWLIFVAVVTVGAASWMAWDFYHMRREWRDLERRMNEQYGYVPTVTDLMNRAQVSRLELSRRHAAARQQSQTRRRGGKARELSRHHRALDILPGYVYLLRDEAGLYKIGLAKDVPTRVKNIQRRHAYKINVVHTVACEYTHLLEHALHHRFEHRHAYGEWFRLSNADATFITSLSDNLDREAIAAIWSPAPPTV